VPLARSASTAPSTAAASPRVSADGAEAAGRGGLGGGVAAAAAGDPLQPPPLLTLHAVQDGRVVELPLEGAALRLPPVPAAGRHALRLWLRGAAPVGAQLVVTLLCPAPVAAGVAVQFRDPFESVTRLFSETNVHTLVAPSAAYEALAVASAAPPAHGALDDGSSSSSAPPPPAVPLVIGQAAMAQVLVRATQPAPLELLGARFVAPAASGLQLANQLADQLPQGPAATGLGGGHVFLLHLLSTRPVAVPGVSMGRLVLTWRRAPGEKAAAAGSGEKAAAAAAAVAAAAVDGPAPDPEVETGLDLPRMTAANSLLTARVVAPPAVTAGIAFPLQLQVGGWLLLGPEDL
jgi:hypothetical protein